jgi:hypothetical protein
MLLVAAGGWAMPVEAQEAAAIPNPVWADSLRSGGGPAFGSPEYDGTRPVAQWCLGPGPWWRTSEPWLRQVLSDTTDQGDSWRRVLGNVPQGSSSDSIRLVSNEARCVQVAKVIHQGLLGWKEGPPPILLADLPDGTLVAWPAATHFGEYGAIVRLNAAGQILAVAFW